MPSFPEYKPGVPLVQLQNNSILYSVVGEGHGNSLQYSCLENPMGGGAWWATVCGVAKSRTRLSNFTFALINYFNPFKNNYNKSFASGKEHTCP